MPSKTASAVPSEFIPLHVPEVGGNAWAYVKECLDTGWVSSVGSFVTRFEQEMARTAGAAHGVAVVNGTAGLHTALKAVGVMPGDEVIVPTLTFVAPVNAVLYSGASPVFMDADAATWQMDTAKLKRFFETECDLKNGACINKKTRKTVRAVVPVHILGYACDIEVIVALAKKFGVKVVEDAAEAVGARLNGKHLGTFGDAGVFSFNGNKILTAGGGGVIVSNDKIIADKARYLSTQAKNDELEYIHDEVGFNYRLTNIQAALGVSQLEQLHDFIARKKKITESYAAAFASLELTLIKGLPGIASNYWLNTVLLPASFSIEDRKQFVRGLIDAKIGARPLWHTIHDLPPYRSFQSFNVEHAPSLYARGVSLPSSSSLADTDLNRVIETVRRLLSK